MNREKMTMLRAVRKAARGQWQLKKELLYKSEVQNRKLENDLGVEIIPDAVLTSELNSVTISWKNAFAGKTLTDEQFEYIYDRTDEMPACETFAEELALESLRAIMIRAMRRAEQGQWYLTEELPENKTALLEESGVKIISFEGKNPEEMTFVDISWETAFDYKSLTLEQSAYVSVWTDEIPTCSNFAEALALRTWRAMAMFHMQNEKSETT